MACRLIRSLLPLALLGVLAWIATHSDAHSLTGPAKAATRRELVINGQDAIKGRYPWFVSLRFLARLKDDSDEDYTYADNDYQLGDYGNDDTPAVDSLLAPSSSTTPPADPRSGYAYRHACGGSLISDRLVLTAAHCLDSGFPGALASDFTAAGLDESKLPPAIFLGTYAKLVVGAEDASTSFQLIDDAALAFIHPKYSQQAYPWDIGVIVLSTPQTDVRTVKLFHSTEDIYDVLSPNEKLTAIGLGNVIDSQDKGSFYVSELFNLTNDQEKTVLEETTIGTLTGRQACAESLAELEEELSGERIWYTVDRTQLCAGEATEAELKAASQNTTAAVKQALQAGNTDLAQAYQGLPKFNDTCQGDSGGPLFIKGATAKEDVQVGIVSFGVGCGLGAASLYTNSEYFLGGGPNEDFLSNIIDIVHGADVSATPGE